MKNNEEPRGHYAGKNEIKAAVSRIRAFKITVCAILIFGFLILNLYGKSETSNVYSELGNVNTLLTRLDGENTTMKAELDSRMVLTNVEEYAENVLCLRKLTPAQIEWIGVKDSAEIEIPEDEPGFFSTVKNALDTFLEYIFS
ncbi:MAG: hypothetical protein LBR54_01645 [Oscillospiraceae bacterium]|jgi:hypothetical protein|nr:hypothetical protein [Oscillospiraceae bacterium]